MSRDHHNELIHGELDGTNTSEQSDELHFPLDELAVAGGGLDYQRLGPEAKRRKLGESPPKGREHDQQNNADDT